jgi:GntR family transcriptional regulator
LVTGTGDAVLQLRWCCHSRGSIVETSGCQGLQRLTASRLAVYGGPMYALFETEFGVHMVRAEKILCHRS